NDYYEKQDQWLDRLAERVAPKIEQEEAGERAITLTFDQFERYFGGFVKSLPPMIALVLKRPMVFFAPSDPMPYWVLDFRKRTVNRLPAPPAERAGIVRIREAVLADAIDKHVVAFVHISMRIRIDLAPGGVQTDFLFWGLLSLAELGYFPLHKMATARAARVLWRRRAEAW
ncbi:MAG: hypothetical protein DMF97_08770, partial [Acidobacteria bacterium]